MNGLPYLKIRPYTDAEWGKLWMVVLTSDNYQDPKGLDYAHTDKDNWYDNIKNLEHNPRANLFYEFGDYKGAHDPFLFDVNNVVNHDALELEPSDDIKSITGKYCNHASVNASPANVQAMTSQMIPDRADYEKQQSFFAFQPADTVRRTYEQTTQHYQKLESGSILHQTGSRIQRNFFTTSVTGSHLFGVLAPIYLGNVR